MKSKKHYILYNIFLLLGLLLFLFLPTIFYSKDIPAQNLTEEYIGISFIGIGIIILLIHLFYRIKKQDYTLSINIFSILARILWIINTSLFLKQAINSYNFRKSLNQPNNILRYYQFQIFSYEILIILLFLNTLFLLFYKIFIKNKK